MVLGYYREHSSNQGGLPKEHQAVRLLSVGVSGFGNTGQTQLSLLGGEEHDSQAKLDQASDEIQEKFGSDSLGRASSLLHGVKHKSQPKPD